MRSVSYPLPCSVPTTEEVHPGLSEQHHPQFLQLHCEPGIQAWEAHRPSLSPASARLTGGLWVWRGSLHSQGHVHPALPTFSDFYKALAPGCRLDHRRVGGGVMGRPASDASSLTLRQRGWSRTAWLASLAAASSGPVCGWQPFRPALVTGPQPPGSRCSFQRPSPGSGSLAESRAWTV